MKVKTYKFLVVAFILLNLPVSKARADVSPPEPPPGSSIAPGEETTMVQMISEQVVLDLTGEEAAFPILACGADVHILDYCNIKGFDVHVTATFNMRNQGSEEENLVVRFPLQLGEGYLRSIIQDFSIMVGGQVLDWQSVILEGKTVTGDFREWAAFSVTFPPNQTKTIKVSYRTLAYKFYKDADRKIGYILETGAGWYGAIGQGEIILRLPYQASRYNVLGFPEGAEFSGREVVWSFEDLEPTKDDNWSVILVHPGYWQRIVEARKVLEKEPDNIEALVELGSASRDAATGYPLSIEDGKEELFFEGLDAYEKVIALAPYDPEILIGYLETIAVQIAPYTYSVTDRPLPGRAEISAMLQRLREMTGESDLSKLPWGVETVAEYYDLPVKPEPTPFWSITQTNKTPSMPEPERTIVATVEPDETSIFPTSTEKVDTPVASSTLEDTAPAAPTATRTEIPQQETEPPTRGWIWLLGIVILFGGGIIWRIHSQEEKTK